MQNKAPKHFRDQACSKTESRFLQYFMGKCVTLSMEKWKKILIKQIYTDTGKGLISLEANI